jgi:hypothetical protein
MTTKRIPREKSGKQTHLGPPKQKESPDAVSGLSIERMLLKCRP